MKSRFEDKRHRALLGGLSWSALHMGEDPTQDMVKAVFAHLMGSGEFDFEASVRDAGGIEAYKDKIASYLGSSDVMARGVAAIALGIAGDPKYAEKIATLLRSTDLHVHLEMLEGYDRGIAMVSLALLGANGYRAEIETHMASALQYESEGAQAALLIMDQPAN